MEWLFQNGLSGHKSHQCDVKQLVHAEIEQEPICKEPRLEIHKKDDTINHEDDTSTLNLDEETSEIRHELKFIYFGKSDDELFLYNTLPQRR